MGATRFKKKSDKKFSLTKAVDATHKLNVVWNENTEMTDDVVHGHHDSIWRFKQPTEMGEFNQELELVRFTVPIDDNN